MKRIVRFSLVLLAVTASLGGECDPKEEEFFDFLVNGDGNGVQVGDLTGTVRGGGSPLTGAGVSLTGPVNRTTTTGAGGMYIFMDIPFGSYTANASATGFTCPSRSVTVSGASTTADIDCTAQPATGTLVVRVLVGGSPHQGASVQIPGRNAVTTGADGTARFENVTPGSQTITTTLAGHSCGSATATVQANQTATVDVTCAPTTGTLVVRVILTPGNTPIGGASVSVSGPGVTLTGTTAADGTVTFQNVAPVQINVNASSDGRACSPATGQVQAGQTTEVTVPCTAVAGSYSNQGLVEENTCGSPFPPAGSSFSNTGIPIAHLGGNQYTLDSDLLMMGMLVGTAFNLQARQTLSGPFDISEALTSTLVRDPITGQIVITGMTTFQLIDTQGTSDPNDDVVACRVVLNPIEFRGPPVASSLQFKRGVRTLLPDGISFLGLRPVSFRYVVPYGDPQVVRLGLIAEEVAAVFPKAVLCDAEGRPRSIHYGVLTGLVIEEIEERMARAVKAGIARLSGAP